MSIKYEPSALNPQFQAAGEEMLADLDKDETGLTINPHNKTLNPEP